MSDTSSLNTIESKLDGLKSMLEKQMNKVETDVIENKTKLDDQKKLIDENQSKIKKLEIAVSDLKKTAVIKEKEMGRAILDVRRRINRR